MRLAACIKSVADQVESLGLSANSKPYQSHFKTLQMACAPMGIDPLHLKERDQNYISLFFVLSRSIHSLDGFWSAIKSIYNLNKRDFPDSKSHRAFKNRRCSASFSWQQTQSGERGQCHPRFSRL